jgi:hypothetical protein
MLHDGKWILRLSTRSILEEVQREIERRKFYATLPAKLDKAEQDWHESQPPAVPPPLQLDDLHIRAPWLDGQETDSTS